MSDSIPQEVGAAGERIEPDQGETSEEDLQREIEGVFVFGEGLNINKCYAAYTLLEKASDDARPKLLRTAAEYMDRAESSKEIQIPIFINSNEQSDLEDRYAPLVDELLELILSDNMPEDEFYRSFWDLTRNPIFPDGKSRVFAFYWIMIDKRIPYFHIGAGTRMTDEEWKAAGKRLATKNSKIRFLLAKGFTQKSEESSLILQEIDELDKQDDRIFALAYVIFRLRKEGETEAERYKRILTRRGLM